jgi:hypothetical protein
MTQNNIFRLCLLLAAFAFSSACAWTDRHFVPADEPSSENAAKWYDLQLKIIKETPGFTAPAAARALAYSGITLYETVLLAMPDNNSLVGQLNDLNSLPKPETGQTYHWQAAANSAMASILLSLYPTTSPMNRRSIDKLEKKYAELYKKEAGEEVFNRSVAFGKEVATAVYEWSKSDGGHNDHNESHTTDYNPPKGPGLWEPTPPDYNRSLMPFLSKHRPFIIKTRQDCLPGPPTEYSEDKTSQFYAEALEVYNTVNNNTVEQRAIARFWADDPGNTSTPPGHSISIASQVLRAEKADLTLAAQTYARMGIALSDAFISCWNTKYTYNLIRPITYIQKFINVKWNVERVTDPVITPPFPEYTSGHSVQSGAAAAVLNDIFGENYSFTDKTHDNFGMRPRSFNSFKEFADEAAISRLYGGTHFRPAIERGLEQGKCIGEKVNSIKWKKEA